MPTINKHTKKAVTYTHKKNDSAKYYNSKWWKLLRNVWITAHPVCHQCSIAGRSVPATQVHHITEFMSGKTDEERWNLLLDPNNLMSLCTECHKKMHGKKTNEFNGL